MRQYIPYIFLAGFMIAFWCFTIEPVCSQTNEIHHTDTAGLANGETSLYSAAFTSGRARSLVGGIVGLCSLIISWRAKSRSTDRRTWAGVALALGLIALLLSGMHLGTSAGGFGTGSGKAGAIVALLLGLTGTAVSGLTLRSKQK